MGRTLSPALGCALLGREMARCVIMCVSGTGATGLSGESRRACDWKTGDKEIWGRGCGQTPQNGEKKVEIFVSHVNAHQKDISADRGFSSQVNRMACSVGTSQLLSLVTAITAMTYIHQLIAKWCASTLYKERLPKKSYRRVLNSIWQDAFTESGETVTPWEML